MGALVDEVKQAEFDNLRVARRVWGRGRFTGGNASWRANQARRDGPLRPAPSRHVSPPTPAPPRPAPKRGGARCAGSVPPPPAPPRRRNEIGSALPLGR